MIEVFAIVDRPEAGLPDGLLCIEHGPIGAVYAPSDGRPEASPEALWSHETFVEELMTDRTVLPLRFGTVLESEDALREVLAERGEEFEALLETVRGRVELAVRVLAPPDDNGEGEPAASGREYMDSLLRRSPRHNETARIVRPLATLSDNTRLQASRESNVARWAFLVDRERIEDFRTELERVKASNPDVALACTGPWPPYSFVGEDTS